MKGKNKKKNEEKPQPKEDKPLQKIDFSLNYIGHHVPILVKVKHFNQTYTIFTEEYKKSIEIILFYSINLFQYIQIFYNYLL